MLMVDNYAVGMPQPRMARFSVPDPILMVIGNMLRRRRSRGLHILRKVNQCLDHLNHGNGGNVVSGGRLIKAFAKGRSKSEETRPRG
jgi:hypothetical protein